jgi:hypothetical protein
MIYSHLSPPLCSRSIYVTLPCSFINELRSQLTRLIRNEPNTAGQNPYTSKPEMTPETILSKNAFIRKVNRPRLRIFIGSVRMRAMGRKKAFNMPRIAAADKAEKKPLTCIPSSRYDVTTIAPVRVNHLKIIPFFLMTKINP